MKYLISLSGGLDSAVLLGQLVTSGPVRSGYRPADLTAVAFTYGSKHNALENRASQAVAAHYGVPWRLVDLTAAFAPFKSDLLLSGGAVPEGHYEAESMRRTVVPCRNLIFLSLLGGLAESAGAAEVYIGAHAGDHHIYPDCRPEFLTAARQAVRLATDGAVTVLAPFTGMTKGDIVRLGLSLGVPLHLTRTCYTDGEVACGRCGSCQERLEAFAQCDAVDPVPYLHRDLLPK